MTTPNYSMEDIISQFSAPRVPFSEKWLKSLEKWLEEPYEGLVHDERSPGLHSSGLHKVCARFEVLSEIFGVDRPPKKSGNFLVFDIGHALHFWWQNRYLGPKQELVGNWMCAACECEKCGSNGCEKCHNTGRKVTRGRMPLSCDCGVPWQDAVKYLELLVVDKELGYVGHADGVLDCEDGVNRLFEFKTIKSSDFDNLEEPKPDHVIQAHSYMRLLGLDEALIVYQDKGKQCEWKFKSPGVYEPYNVHLKPFLVEFDGNLWREVELRIRDYHKARKLIDRRRKSGKQPTKSDVKKFERVCEDRNCSMARFCPLQNQCFTLD